MSKIDLHIHSNCSDDGELTPAEIIMKCQVQGMELVAITDHNSVRGVSDALAAANGLRVLSGVELDCNYAEKGFHLLGYGFDSTQKEFAEIEQDILLQEQAAAEKKIHLFHSATGIPISLADTYDFAPNGVVTGELIAEILLSRADAAEHPLLLPYLQGGAKSDMPNVRFYWDFFAQSKVAYVPISYLPLADAVKLIHSAGGIAVLAHPGQNLGNDDSLLSEIVRCGVDGIEAFSSYHNTSLTAYYLQAAEQLELMVTCGSDYHGKHKPAISIGGHGAYWSDEKLFEQLLV